MTELHLVRHGPPAVDHAVPAARWPLCADAPAEIAALAAAGVLPRSARWFSSPEPKAGQTARELTAEAVTMYDALGEVERPAGVVDDFAGAVRQGFADPDASPLPGWETCAAARRRIGRGVRKLLDAYQGETLVVVGHGTVLTLLVAELTNAPVDTAAWEQMTFPDHCVLDGGDADRLVRAWGSWR